MIRGMSALEVIDGVGRRVHLARAPRRIVSLVPSTTETLAALGCADAVVGRTRYCVHPAPWVESVASVGGTKAQDLATLKALAPDLILANEEENRPALWAGLEAIAPLYVAYPRTLDDALGDLRVTSRLVGAEVQGAELVAEIRAARELLRRVARPFRFAYLIWRHPWMAVNGDTFLSALLGEAGGVNVLGDSAERYPALTLAELEAVDPEVVFLPSEPYAFDSRHAEELGALASRARLVDGELLSWHGARLVSGLPYLAALLDELPG
jgi:iron complex transport system substrate-binding protein